MIEHPSQTIVTAAGTTAIGRIFDGVLTLEKDHIRQAYNFFG